ncbi:hypothetical protein [Streptomyces sp. NPDC002533]
MTLWLRRRSQTELLTGAPLAPNSVTVQTKDDFAVQFLRERPFPGGGPGAAADVIEINDTPVSSAPHRRAHAGRRLHHTMEQVSRAPAGPRRTLLTHLIDFAHAEEHA